MGMCVHVSVPGTVWLALGIILLIVGTLFAVPSVLVCRRFVNSMVEEEVRNLCVSSFGASRGLKYWPQIAVTPCS
jgi:hypothetical protein